MGKENRSLDSRKTIKTALLNTVANAVALVVGMIMIPIITRVISQTDLGIASTFQANRNILVILVTLAAYSFVHRAMLEFAEDKKNYILTISLFCSVMVLLVFLASLLMKGSIKEILSLDDFSFYWLFISILSYALYSIASYYCIFHNYAVLVFMMAISVGPIAQLLSVGLACFLSKQKYIGRIVGLDAVYVIVSVVLIVWLLSLRNKHIRKGYIKSTLVFTIPIIPHWLAQMILTQSDLVMISYFSGEGKSGIYSMGHTVGFLAYSVMSQIMTAWSPWVYRRIEEKNFKSIKQNVSFILLIGFYMTIGLMTVAPEVIQIFLPADYLPCIYIIPPLVIAMFFLVCYTFFYDLEYYYKKTSWIAIASIVSAVSNLILNYICIGRFGYIAACYTTMFCYLILLVISYLFSRRLNVQNIYSVSKIVYVNVAAIIYMIVIFVFMDMPVVRYLLLGLTTIILFASQYKRMINIWNMIRNDH